MTPDELEQAAQVHYSFLPEDFRNEHIDIAVTVQPANRLGGDYCSILPIDEQCVMVCMCDAVGHGIASALYAARINTFVLTHALRHPDPCEIMENLNEYLCRRLSSTGMYTSFCALLFNFATGQLRVASAAHPPVIYYRPSVDEEILLQSESTFLGFQHPMPITCGVTNRNLESGDRLVIYSDGLIEGKDSAGGMWGSERLIEAVRDHSALGNRAFNDALYRDSKAHALEHEDDVMLLTAEVR